MVTVMNAIAVVDLVDEVPVLRIIRDRSNPLEYLTISEFKERYRLREDNTVSLH